MAEHDMVVQLLTQIQGEMRTGFAGVHQRQDIANGRLNKAEVSIGQLQERTSNMVCADHQVQFESLRDDIDELRENRPQFHQDRRVWVGTGIGTAVTALIWAGVKVLEALAQHASQAGTIMK